MMPMSLAVQVVVITLVFLSSWNNYLLPLLLLKDENMYTIPMGVVHWGQRAQAPPGLGHVSYDQLFAGLFVMAAPTVILFLALQRWFVAGVVQGAIKA